MFKEKGMSDIYLEELKGKEEEYNLRKEKFRFCVDKLDVINEK